MSNIGNKETFAKNLVYYIERSGKNQKEIAEIIGVASSTFTEWTKAKKYPRIDKIEKLANLFGILKSDLIEDKQAYKQNNNTIVDIVVRLRSDETYMEVCNKLSKLDNSRLLAVQQMLKAFLD